MRKRIGKAIFILVIFNFLPTNTMSQHSLFVSGTVKWDTGIPAAGFEVRLVEGSVIKAKAYTNQAGRYAFFGIGGIPSQYILMVFSRNRMLKEIPLHNVPVGGRVPDIILK